jgi:hypothetical protein
MGPARPGRSRRIGRGIRRRATFGVDSATFEQLHPLLVLGLLEVEEAEF